MGPRWDQNERLDDRYFAELLVPVVGCPVSNQHGANMGPVEPNLGPSRWTSRWSHVHDQMYEPSFLERTDARAQLMRLPNAANLAAREAPVVDGEVEPIEFDAS